MFVKPPVAPRTFDFDGEALFQTELYGPKVRVSNMDEVGKNITNLIQLLKQPVLQTEREVQRVKDEIQQLEYPARWDQVTDIRYVDKKAFAEDEVALTTLVYSIAIEKKRSLKKPIKLLDNTFQSLPIALNRSRGGRTGRYLDLQTLNVVTLKEPDVDGQKE